MVSFIFIGAVRVDEALWACRDRDSTTVGNISQIRLCGPYRLFAAAKVQAVHRWL